MRKDGRKEGRGTMRNSNNFTFIIFIPLRLDVYKHKMY